MIYTQFDTVKAFGDELRRQALVTRLTADEDGQRAGPLSWLRHRAGHALIAVGQTMAHGGQASAHIARIQRHAD